MRNVKIGFLNEMERNVLKMIDDGKPLDDGVWGTGDEWLENLSNGKQNKNRLSSVVVSANPRQLRSPSPIIIVTKLLSIRHLNRTGKKQPIENGPKGIYQNSNAV